MAATLTTKLDLRILAVEEETNDSGTSKLSHAFNMVRTIATGTGVAQNDRVYYSEATATAAPLSLDLLGGLTSLLTGDAFNAADCISIGVANLSETTGDVLTLGGGANAFATWGSGRIIGPGGWDFWYYGNVDSIAPGAGATDILTVDPGANTVEYAIFIIAHSA